MRASSWLMVTGIAVTAMGCAGMNANQAEGEPQWVDESSQDCEDISPALCAYSKGPENALDELADRANDVSKDVSEGMPAALRARSILSRDFAMALQAYAVPSESALGLNSASEEVRIKCLNECVKAEQAALVQRVSSQIQGSSITDFVEEMRSSITLSCEPGKGSMAHVTDACIARLNPAQKARTWLMNRSEERYRMAFKTLVQSISPVQQLVLFKTEMALNFASLSDAELDALYEGLVAAKKTAQLFIRLCDTSTRATPLRVLDPIDRWTHSVAEITGAIDTTAKQCGSGCSPAWRKAAGR